MIQNLFMDLDMRSQSYSHTPGTLGNKLPAHLLACGHFLAGKNYFTEREGLDNYLLLYTLSGKGLLRWGLGENQTRVTLKPGYAVLFHCFAYQQYATECAQWDFLWCHINGAGVKAYHDIINTDVPQPVYMGDKQESSVYLDSLIRMSSNHEPLLDVKASSLLAAILSEMSICRMKQQTEGSKAWNRENIEKAIEYVQRHYSENISVQTLANTAHVSRYHFSRIFKAYTGQSPIAYLINFRINISRKMLRETDLGVHVIASSCGFGDANGFIRCFKSALGMTPLKYRKFKVG